MPTKTIPKLTKVTYVEVEKDYPAHPHYIMEMLNQAYMMVPEEFRENCSVSDFDFYGTPILITIKYTQVESDEDYKKRCRALARVKKKPVKRKK